MIKICILPGDGVGPEVTREAVKVLHSVFDMIEEDIDLLEAEIGGEAIDACGVPLPAKSLDGAFESHAVLLGAVGGEKWDDLPAEIKPEQGLLKLRKQLDLYANIRPVKTWPLIAQASPLKNVAEGAIRPDLVFVRELSSGIYFGEPRYRDTAEDGSKFAVDTLMYSATEVERVAKSAFILAQKRKNKVTSVDKANVLETSRLWRETVEQTARSFPEVALEHLYVDNCAMQLIKRPQEFDVILTGNMFGDILSDLASVFPGSIGFLPSASKGTKGIDLYEPVHGSAPTIAGKDEVNPVAAILCGAMLMRETLGRDDLGALIEESVDRILKTGYCTKDVCMDSNQANLVKTSEMGDLIVDQIKERGKASG